MASTARLSVACAGLACDTTIRCGTTYACSDCKHSPDKQSGESSQPEGRMLTCLSVPLPKSRD